MSYISIKNGMCINCYDYIQKCSLEQYLDYVSQYLYSILKSYEWNIIHKEKNYTKSNDTYSNIYVSSISNYSLTYTFANKILFEIIFYHIHNDSGNKIYMVINVFDEKLLNIIKGLCLGIRYKLKNYGQKYKTIMINFYLYEDELYEHVDENVDENVDEDVDENVDEHVDENVKNTMLNYLSINSTFIDDNEDFKQCKICSFTDYLKFDDYMFRTVNENAYSSEVIINNFFKVCIRIEQYIHDIHSELFEMINCRLNYIKLYEGIPYDYFDKQNEHIIKYLLNEVICKEICSF